MKSYNPDELTAKVKQEQEETSNLAVETLQWFLDDNRIGELYPRSDVVQALSEHLGVDNSKASIALSSVVGDIVDPVQQITTEEGKFIGIIDYNVYDDSGAYGYIHFDDRQLQRKRVVCAKCVEEAELDGEVVHATQGEGSSSKDVSWEQLLDKVTSHYADAHTEAPEEIEPGASLVSDTTISGNTAFHAGNESTIDHNNLSSRTHEGDDITPDNVTTDVDVEAGRDVSVGQHIDSISRKILFEEGPSVTNQWLMSVISGDFVIGYGDSSETFSTVSINQSEVDMSGKNLLIDTINGSQPGGGSAIGGSVANYSDLPFNLSERQLYYVSSENDIVVQTDSELDFWRSISDFTTVANPIPDSNIAFSIDGGSIYLFNGPSSGRSLRKEFTDDAGGVTYVALSREYVAFDGANNNIYIYDQENLNLQYELTDTPTFNQDIEISDSYVGAACDNGNAYIWDLSDGSLAYTFTQAPSSDYLNSIDFSDPLVAYSSNEPGAGVYVHSLLNGSLIYNLTESPDSATMKSVSITQESVAYGGNSDEVYIHDMSNGNLTTTVSSGQNVDAVELDDPYILFSDDDGNDEFANYYNFKTSSLVYKLQKRSPLVNSVDISTRYLAYSSSIGIVQIYNRSDGSHAYELNYNSNLTPRQTTKVSLVK